MIIKKSVLCASVYLFSSLLHTRPAAAIEPGCVETTASASSFDAYVSSVYNKIDFGKGEKLNADLFSKAMHGYLNLKNAGKLASDKQILTIADFTRSSTTDRFWVIDLKAGKVLFHTMVAHGSGSGDDFATAFSNQNDSHQSSLGFYVTGDTYIGEHGNSLRLIGLESGFNSAALDRGIVVHAAQYVSKDFVAGNQRLGRSWGCPAVNPKLAQPIINAIKGGTCLFLYYPQKQYLHASVWLNKKVENLPYSLPAMQPLKPAESRLAIAKAAPKHDSAVSTITLPATNSL